MNTLTEPRPGPTIRPNNATLINQTSGDVEYYTPIEIVNAARRVMDRIELDPASSSLANDRVGGVGADCWFGIEDHSLERAWTGGTWLNHPFGRAEEACKPDCEKHLINPRHKHHSFEWFGNAVWINKLCRECEIGNVDEACCITYACTSEQWFQPLLKRVQCFLVPRTNYYLPDGSILKGVTKGSVVTYFGSRPKRFAEIFSKLGVVKTTL